MGRALREIFNEGNPNKVAAAAQVGRLGSFLALVPRLAKGAVTTHVMTLPENARARVILAAISTAGTLTGNLTPIAGGAPTTGQVGITPTGNIIFATADAVTAAEVIYVSHEGDIIEETVRVVAHVATPTGGRNATLLLSAVATAGTLPGTKVVDFRGAAIATTEAGINAAGTGIVFATADAVTTATIKYVATPGIGSARTALGVNLDSTDRAF